MKKVYSFVVAVFVVVFFNQNQLMAQCPVGGNATASEDSICDNGTTTLMLAGYVGNIQWQNFNGSAWVNETGPGSTTDTYTVTVATSTTYRAFLTLAACPSDSSNLVTITTGIIPLPTGTGATRCGYGQVSLQGSGTGTVSWYAAATGGNPLASGSPFVTTVSSTTTYYLQNNLNGGSGGASQLQITELDLGASDVLELQNVSNQPVDVTGWSVAINNSYTDINLVNANVQTLSGIMQPGDIITFTDNAAGPNYWGSNMLWNPGAFPTFTGWVMVLDPNYVLMDFIALNWPTVNIASMNPVVNGNAITVGAQWNGDGVDISTVAAASGVSRQGNQDNNVNTDFVISPLSSGTTNSVLMLPFSGFGCSSLRVPVVATVTFADPVNINATATALCQGTSATLSATSNNGAYSYTWSPAMGLNTTTGATVIATPLAPTTYTVVGTDGTCANIDSVYINVGPASVAGMASISSDTICSGTTAALTLNSSTGTIQWQSNTGSGWVNETGIGFDSSLYIVSPTLFTQYMAVVTSGGCASDTSIVLSVAVLTVTDPTTVNDTICGAGTVNLTASGTGVLNWYAGLTGNTVLNSGTSYSPIIASTTTYYVEASAGATYHVGPVNSSIGNQTTSAATDYGMQFDCNKQCILQRVYISAAQTGPITVNLRATQGGPILQTLTTNVTAFGGFVPLDLGFSISPGTGYRLELAAGSVQLYRNATGAVYPYSSSNCPITITGYVNPNFATGALYFWFYDWVVDDGCHSNRIPVTGVINFPPSVPTINQVFNTLNSSSPTGNQWYFNGVIMVGETGQVLTISQTGNYTVLVTDANGCSTLSGVFSVTFIGTNEIGGSVYSIYPNPSTGDINIRFASPLNTRAEIKMFDAFGKNVFEKTTIGVFNDFKLNTHLPAGNYILEIRTDLGVVTERIEVLK